MSDARKILDRLAAERAHGAQEERRWDGYRRLCTPPRWFLMAIYLVGLGSAVLLAGALLGVKDRASLELYVRTALLLCVVVVLPLGFYLERRRRTGLRKILEQEAPELAAKLREERILR